MNKVGDGSFGARLRALREAAGLTQGELASRAGLAAKGVSALERGERKRPYPHTVRSLTEALGLDDEQRSALLSAVQRQGRAKPGPETTSQRPALAVPPTPLLGREKENANLRAAMSRALSEGETGVAARLGWALWLFWWVRGTSRRAGAGWRRCSREIPRSPRRR